MYNSTIKWSIVSEAGDDSLQFPQQRISYLGKLADGVPVYPYGFHAVADPQSMALTFTSQSTPDNISFIPTSNQKRQVLMVGETTHYHPQTDAHLTWREGGILEIETGDGGQMPITIVCNQASIQASESVEITSPQTTINGNLTIEGNYTSNGTMTNNGQDVGNTHGHAQGNDSRGDGEQPIQGVT